MNELCKHINPEHAGITCDLDAFHVGPHKRHYATNGKVRYRWGNEAPKRTTLDVMESQAKAELNFLTEKLESNLKWLESEIRTMRRDVAKGSIFPSTNMTKMAADTDQIHTRLKYATEALMTIQTLQEEAK